MIDILVDETMEKLDSWVSLRDNGRYLPSNATLLGDNISIIRPETMNLGLLHEGHGIQQVRDEIKEFVRALISLDKKDSILEIGLGHHGSTHFLWRLIFNEAITVEKSYERVREFSNNMRSFYNKWVFDDLKSRFIIGYSYEPRCVSMSRSICKNGIEVLFIDGDHSYDSVLTDWLLYSPLVRKGGIVAFHDSASKRVSDVPILLDELKDGKFDGKKRVMNDIIKSNICGITYYINE